MTAPAFTFRGCNTSRGSIDSGEGSAEFYHPLLPVTLFSAAGYLLILNGWNLNRMMSDTVGYDGTASTAVQMLQMRAPREAIMPFISWPGSGRVFRPGAKYRYRWRDSRTGIASGLSPLPTASVNLGVLAPAGSSTYIGQQSSFYLSTTNKPPHADTIDLFANTTNEDTVWYLADTQPTGSSSYILLRDNNTDDELFLKDYVVTGSTTAITPGPTWSTGLMYPLVKAWQHASGRTFFYGLRRFGKSGPMGETVSVTQGSDLVTLNGTLYSPPIENGRIGQRVSFYTLPVTTFVPLVDPTVYRIVKVESSTTFRVWPEIAVSASVTSGATVNLYYAIEDDRDSRWTWISEPNRPWLIDPLKIVATGDDFDDNTLHWFGVQHSSVLSGNLVHRTYVQTTRSIFEANNADTNDPSTTMTFTHIADEGSVGFWAGCETPFGWVYVNALQGVRLFDGQISAPLGRQVSPDGSGGYSGDPFAIFLARTQFQNMDPAALEEVRCVWDADNHIVIVSYVPTGQSTLKECLVYSGMDKTWRGPYRDCVTASGLLSSSVSPRQFVIGDGCGNLLTREAQALDVTPTITNFTGTGSITTVTTNRVFIDSAAHFSANSDEALRGSPVWFYDGTYYYFARIADVLSDTQLELDGPPVREDGTLSTLTANWTYGVGSIRWSLTTGYLGAPDTQDALGDPAKQSKFYTLDCRFVRGTGSETFEAGLSWNADGTYKGVRLSATSSPVPTRDVNGAIHAEMRFIAEAGVVQLRMRGISRLGLPQITEVLLLGEEMDNSISG